MPEDKAAYSVLLCTLEERALGLTCPECGAAPDVGCIVGRMTDGTWRSKESLHWRRLKEAVKQSRKL